MVTAHSSTIFCIMNTIRIQCQFAVMKALETDQNHFVPLKIKVDQPTLFTWHQIYDDAGEDVGQIHYSHPIQYKSLKRGAEARLATLMKEHNECI